MRGKEPSESAYAYARGEDILLRHGIAEAEAKRTLWEKRLAHYRKIPAALESEIRQVEQRLRHRQSAVNAALARVVASGAEWQALLQDITAAWSRLSTLWETAAMVLSRTQATYHVVQNVEPLERRVNFDIDEVFFDRWSGGLARLLDNPDTSLPAGDGC
jgi:hypothetical protein